MKQKPKLTVAGYRGIWGESLDQQIAFEYSLSFAKLINKNGGKKILIGRDARTTGNEILISVKNALKKENIEFVDVGIIPTPSMLLLVKKLSFDGGIVITASHNPIEYNGLKFIMEDGFFTNEEDVSLIEENKSKLNEEEKVFKNKLENTRSIDTNNEEYRKIHIEQILKNIDVDLIKNKKFKVSLDPINSAGSIITKELLKELDCEINIINEEMTGNFAHEPEPLIKNLSAISELVKKTKSDIGFAQDPDADRLMLIDENGNILSEEYTLAIAVKSILMREQGDIAINLSTSRMSEDIVNSYGKKALRTKVGEANVVKGILENKAITGGEGSGGAIYPKINPARDSLVGIALTLELLAKEDKALSNIIDSMPKYFMKKEKFEFKNDLEKIYAILENEWGYASINKLDGIRFEFDDLSWIHIRPSNTEPIIRAIGESKDEKILNQMFEKARLTLNQY